MWRLVREGVRFYRPVLLTSWAFGVGIFFLVLAIMAVVGSVHDLNEIARTGVQLPLAILIASMVAGFIVDRHREEREQGPHAPDAPGADRPGRGRPRPAARRRSCCSAWWRRTSLFAVLLALEGSPVLSPRHLNVDFIGVQLLFWLQVALAIREVIELRHRMSWTGALGPKALLVTAVALMAVVQLGPLAQPCPPGCRDGGAGRARHGLHRCALPRRSLFTK